MLLDKVARGLHLYIYILVIRNIIMLVVSLSMCVCVWLGLLSYLSQSTGTIRN